MIEMRFFIRYILYTIGRTIIGPVIGYGPFKNYLKFFV